MVKLIAYEKDDSGSVEAQEMKQADALAIVEAMVDDEAKEEEEEAEESEEVDAPPALRARTTWRVRPRVRRTTLACSPWRLSLCDCRRAASTLVRRASPGPAVAGPRVGIRLWRASIAGRDSADGA